MEFGRCLRGYYIMLDWRWMHWSQLLRGKAGKVIDVKHGFAKKSFDHRYL
jgi:hypothetical protein